MFRLHPVHPTLTLTKSATRIASKKFLVEAQHIGLKFDTCLHHSQKTVPLGGQKKTEQQSNTTMRTAINILILLATLLFSAETQKAQAQDTRSVIDGTTESLRKGNADMLSRHFSSTIEIDLLGAENFYSKPQATLLIKNFLAKNQPTDFSIAHEGIKEATAFAIGTQRTSDAAFRVSIFIKTENNHSYIHQLRIERNNP